MPPLKSFQVCVLVVGLFLIILCMTETSAQEVLLCSDSRRNAVNGQENCSGNPSLVNCAIHSENGDAIGCAPDSECPKTLEKGKLVCDSTLKRCCCPATSDITSTCNDWDIHGGEFCTVDLLKDLSKCKPKSLFCKDANGMTQVCEENHDSCIIGKTTGCGNGGDNCQNSTIHCNDEMCCCAAFDNPEPCNDLSKPKIKDEACKLPKLKKLCASTALGMDASASLGLMIMLTGVLWGGCLI